MSKHSDPAKRLRSFRVKGSLLRSLRLARGWTQHEAAERSGMTDRFIRKAEAGQPLELKSIALLAELYGTPESPLSPQQLLAEPLAELMPPLPPHPQAAARGEAGNLPLPPHPQAGTRDRAEGSNLPLPPGDGRGEGGPALSVPTGATHTAEALVRRWFKEVWNQGRLETIEELVAPDAVLRAEGAMLRGPAEIRGRTQAMRAAFSDFDMRIQQVTVHGDWVVARWRVAMTHTGAWMGTAPTGQRVEAYGSTWIRVVDGLFVEGWDYWEQQQTTDALRDQAKRKSPRPSRRKPRKGT